MSAGKAIEQAMKSAGRAIGPLTYMLVKERVSRAMLEQAATDLESAAAIIRSVLPRPQPPEYSAQPPGEEIKSDKDEDHGTTDARR